MSLTPKRDALFLLYFPSTIVGHKSSIVAQQIGTWGLARGGPDISPFTRGEILHWRGLLEEICPPQVPGLLALPAELLGCIAAQASRDNW